MVEQIERSGVFNLSCVESGRVRALLVDTKKVRVSDQIDLSFCIGSADVISQE